MGNVFPAYAVDGAHHLHSIPNKECFQSHRGSVLLLLQFSQTSKSAQGQVETFSEGACHVG